MSVIAPSHDTVSPRPVGMKPEGEGSRKMASFQTARGITGRPLLQPQLLSRELDRFNQLLDIFIIRVDPKAGADGGGEAEFVV